MSTKALWLVVREVIAWLIGIAIWMFVFAHLATDFDEMLTGWLIAAYHWKYPIVSCCIGAFALVTALALLSRKLWDLLMEPNLLRHRARVSE